MARGDSNILFSPIIPKKKYLLPLKKGEFARSPKEILFTKDSVFMISSDGLFASSRASWPEEDSWNPLPPDSSAYFLSRAGFAWVGGDPEEVEARFIKDPGNLPNPVRLAGPEGEISHLYVSDDAIYCFCKKSDGTTKLVKSAGQDWQNLSDHYSHDGEVLLQAKMGGDAFALYRGGDGEEISLLSLTLGGAGHLHHLSPSDSRRIFPGSLEDGSWANLVARERDDLLWYLDREKNQLVLFSFSGEEVRERVSFPEDISHPLQLESAHGRVALLTQEALFLLKEEGDGFKKIDISDNYQQMILLEDEIILWNKGRLGYLRLDIGGF